MRLDAPCQSPCENLPSTDGREEDQPAGTNAREGPLERRVREALPEAYISASYILTASVDDLRGSLGRKSDARVEFP